MVGVPFPTLGGFSGLRVDRVLEAWDRELLVALVDDPGQYYLAVLVEEVPVEERWLLAEIPEASLRELLAGDVEYRRLFEDSQRLQVAVLNLTNGTWSLEEPPSEVGELFPEAGERYESEIAVTAPTQITARVSLTPSIGDGNAVPLRVLGNVLKLLQAIVDSIAAGLAGHKGTRGQLPKKIVSGVQMEAVATFAGSFGVELRRESSFEQGQLFEDPDPLSEALQGLTRLLDHADHAPKIRTEVDLLGRRVMGHYSALMTNLQRAESGMRLDWHAASGKSGHGELRSSDVPKVGLAVSSVVESTAEEFAITGELTEFDKDRRTFRISVEGGEQFEGKLDSAFSLDSVTVGRPFDATIKARSTVNPTTLDEKVTYVLTALEAVRVGNS